MSLMSLQKNKKSRFFTVRKSIQEHKLTVQIIANKYHKNYKDEEHIPNLKMVKSSSIYCASNFCFLEHINASFSHSQDSYICILFEIW